MEQADWDDFALYFAQDASKRVSAQRRAFLRKQGEEADDLDDETDAYRMAFLSAWSINIDWREGVFTLLESLDEQLDDSLFSVEFDYDSEIETATVTLKGTSYIFQHAAVGEDGFEQTMARIEPLLLQIGYSLRAHVESLSSDTLTLVVLPDTFWQRANNLFGPQTVMQHFLRYGHSYTRDSQGIYSPAEPAAPPREKLAWWVFLPGAGIVVWALYQTFWVEPPPPPERMTCEDVEDFASAFKVKNVDEIRASLRQKHGCPPPVTEGD